MRYFVLKDEYWSEFIEQCNSNIEEKGKKIRNKC